MNKRTRRRLFGTEEEIQASLDYERKILNAVEAAYGIEHINGAELVRLNYYKDFPTEQYKTEVTTFLDNSVFYRYAWGKTQAKAWEMLYNIIKKEFRDDMNRRRKALKILE